MNDIKCIVEEEKTARDAYKYLNQIWDLRVFNNIKQSEKRHLQMIKNLLNNYKIDYHMSEERGVFTEQLS